MTTRVKVPKMVNAVILKRHFRSNGRTDFGTHSWVKTQMIAMAAAADDEKGHFIGSQFSGPIAWYNLTPQHKGMNRNVANKMLSTYYDLEGRVAAFLQKGGPNAQVQFDVVATPIDKPRPDAFVVRIRYIDSNGKQVNQEETSVPNSKGMRG